MVSRFNLALAVASVLGVAMIAQAQDVQIRDAEVAYKDIPKVSQRKGESNYTDQSPYRRHPGFDKGGIELIKSSKVENFELLNDIKSTSRYRNWSQKHSMDLSGLQWLDLRDLDVAAAVVVSDGTLTMAQIPLVWSIRYIDANSPTLGQGTLFVGGALIVKVAPNGRIVELTVEQYTDSQRLEKVGRSLGFISKFDGDFAKAVSIPVLKKFLSQGDNLAQALQVSGAEIGINQSLQRP